MRLPLRIAMIGLILLLGLIAFAVAGELVVLLALVALPLLALRTGSRICITIAAFVAAAGLLLHFMGFKLYGSARIAHSPPLPHSRTLAALVPPNQLRFSNGETATLADIDFPSPVNLEGLFDDAASPSSDFRAFELFRELGTRGRERELRIEVQTDPQTGHAFIQRRADYWCGNTFFPTFLPRRLPSHVTIDLGQALVRARLAIPAEKPGNDGAYRRKLLDALASAQGGYWYFSLAMIPPHDPAAVALGRSLTSPAAMDFVTGAFLLIAAQETTAYPELEREILRREEVNRRDYDEIAQSRDPYLETLLVWMSYEQARRRLLPISFEGRSYDHDWEFPIAVLAGHGDLQGFDAAVRHLTSLSLTPDEKERWETRLKLYFRWPENTAGFPEWYQGVRPRLKPGLDENNHLVFWLDQGRPFDAAYFASMPPLKSGQ